MRCRDVHALATAYLDGELADARASALRGHVRMCTPCLTLIQDTAEIRDTLAGLEPEDPPPSLWAAVERGLAAAEMADAQRSPWWLRWQQVRPKLLPAAVTMAATVAVGLWMFRSPAPMPAHEHASSAGVTREPSATAAVAPDRAADVPAPGPAEDFFARRADEIAHADQRYESILGELRQLAATERAGWPADVVTRFDSRMAAFHAETRRYHQSLDSAGAASDVRGRDALYAVYQDEIAFLQRATLYGASALDDQPYAREDGP